MVFIHVFIRLSPSVQVLYFFAHASSFFLLVFESYGFFLAFLALIQNSLRRLLTVLAETVILWWLLKAAANSFADDVLVHFALKIGLLWQKLVFRFLLLPDLDFKLLSLIVSFYNSLNCTTWTLHFFAICLRQSFRIQHKNLNPFCFIQLAY